MPPVSMKPVLVIRGLSARATRGQIEIGPHRLSCALGRSGRRAVKREGDGATPIGLWRLRMVYYRADRLSRPRTQLLVCRIGHQDGWCDAPADRNYNRRVQRPYPASAENMWRDDGLYDLVVVLGYNDRPRRRGAGSAIFIHIARAGFEPTAGCVALRRGDLVKILRLLRRDSRLLVTS